MSTSPSAFLENIQKVTVDDVKSAAGKVKLKAVYFLEGEEVEKECNE